MKAETIEIVKATAPVIKEHGQAITQRMYEIAFAARPDARSCGSLAEGQADRGLASRARAGPRKPLGPNPGGERGEERGRKRERERRERGRGKGEEENESESESENEGERREKGKGER